MFFSSLADPGITWRTFALLQWKNLHPWTDDTLTPISLIIINRYGTNIDDDVFCNHDIYRTFVIFGSPSGFFFFLKLVKVFLSQFEGLSSEGVTSVQIEKPTRGNNFCDFGL